MNTIMNNKTDMNNIVIFLIITIVIIYAFYIFSDNSNSKREHLNSTLTQTKKVAPKKNVRIVKKLVPVPTPVASTTPVSTSTPPSEQSVQSTQSVPSNQSISTTSSALTTNSMSADNLKALLSSVDSIDLNNVTIKNLNITGKLTAGEASIDATTGDIIANNLKSNGTFGSKAIDSATLSLLPKILPQETVSSIPSILSAPVVATDFSKLSSLNNLNITGKLTIGNTVIDAETGNLLTNNLVTTGNAKIGGMFGTSSFDPSVFEMLPKQEIIKQEFIRQEILQPIVKQEILQPIIKQEIIKQEVPMAVPVPAPVDFSKLTSLPNLNITGKLTVGNTVIDAETGKLTTPNIYSLNDINALGQISGEDLYMNRNTFVKGSANIQGNTQVGGALTSNSFNTNSFSPNIYSLLPKQEIIKQEFIRQEILQPIIKQEIIKQEIPIPVPVPAPIDFSKLTNLPNLNIAGKLTVGNTVIDAESGKLTSPNIYSLNNISAGGSITGQSINGENLSVSKNTQIGGSLYAKQLDPYMFTLLPKQEVIKQELSSVPNLNVTGKLTVGNTTINATDGSVNVGGKITAGKASLDPSSGNFITSGSISGESIATNTSIYLPNNASITSFSDGRVGLGQTKGMLMYSPDGTLRVFDGKNLSHVI